VRRRDFITVLGGAAIWPLAGHVQLAERIRSVGLLMPWPETEPLAQESATAFKQELGRLGWVAGTNIRIDYRFAGDDPSLIKKYAAELVGMSPDVILASTNPTIAALQQQTHTIPIVFALVADPVGFGFVQSFARPAGNITGFNSYPEPMAGKWLQLLKEAAPSITRVAVIYSGDIKRFAAFFNRMIEAAAPSFGLTVVQAPVYDDAGIEQTVAAFASEPGGSLIALPNSFNTAHGGVIVAAALRHGLPLLGTPDFPGRGGLLSYSLDLVERHAQAAGYVDRILRGANPADLPVQQPTKYSLIINLKTAKALGLTVPPSMLDLADEVIE
jgi:putative tryptophan/tyrosine transport system substrate-binding protein